MDAEKCCPLEVSIHELGVGINGILFFLGMSLSDAEFLGSEVSVAPNDSGGPIVDAERRRIIGVMTTTTLKQSLKFGLPTVSTGTSILTKPNLDFILKNLGDGQ